MSINGLIEKNRQTGTTTALAELILEKGGYLIVGSIIQVNLVLKSWPKLKGKVFSLKQIKDGAYNGLPPEKVFFDTTAVLDYLSGKNRLIKALQETLDELEQ